MGQARGEHKERGVQRVMSFVGFVSCDLINPEAEYIS